jgi:Skp family chaperone for outer membrane proteins
MNLTRTLPSLPLVLVLAALVAWQAMGQRGAGPAPITLATIRMDTLVENLDERADAKADIARLEREIADEEKLRKDELTRLEEEFKDLLPGPVKEEMRERIALRSLQFKSWYEGTTAELEAEKALRLQDLYRKIKSAIADMAGTAGYDVVLQNDESSDLPFDSDSRVPAQVQVLQQISSRKVLHLKPAVDVTQDLIVRMNNQHRAGNAPPARKNP